MKTKQRVVSAEKVMNTVKSSLAKKFNVLLMAGLMCVCFATPSFASQGKVCPPKRSKGTLTAKFTGAILFITTGKVRCFYDQAITFDFEPDKKNEPYEGDQKYELFNGDSSYWKELDKNTYNCNGKKDVAAPDKEADANRKKDVAAPDKEADANRKKDVAAPNQEEADANGKKDVTAPSQEADANGKKDVAAPDQEADASNCPFYLQKK